MRGDQNGDGHQNLDDARDIYLLRPDGSGERRIDLKGMAAFSPSWSSDGRWIAFSANLGGSQQLWMVDIAFGELVRLSSSGPYFHPTWEKR